MAFKQLLLNYTPEVASPSIDVSENNPVNVEEKEDSTVITGGEK